VIAIGHRSCESTFRVAHLTGEGREIVLRMHPTTLFVLFVAVTERREEVRLLGY